MKNETFLDHLIVWMQLAAFDFSVMCFCLVFFPQMCVCVARDPVRYVQMNRQDNRYKEAAT